MTPRSSCLGEESTPLRGAHLRLVTNQHCNRNCGADLAAKLLPGPTPWFLSYKLPGSFLESSPWSLLESAEGDQTIMDIAGHVSRQMMARYSHIRMEAKRGPSKPSTVQRKVVRLRALNQWNLRFRPD